MQNIKRYNFRSLVLAAAAGLLLMSVVYQVLQKPIRMKDRITSPGFGWSWDFDYQRAKREPTLTLDSPVNRIKPRDKGLLVLKTDDPISISGLKITYRGQTPSGDLRLDVSVSALDPEYAYPYRISLSQARKGFSLFDRHFVLDLEGPAFIRLKQSGHDRNKTQGP